MKTDTRNNIIGVKMKELVPMTAITSHADNTDSPDVMCTDCSSCPVDTDGV